MTTFKAAARVAVAVWVAVTMAVIAGAVGNERRYR